MEARVILFASYLISFTRERVFAALLDWLGSRNHVISLVRDRVYKLVLVRDQVGSCLYRVKFRAGKCIDYLRC